MAELRERVKAVKTWSFDERKTNDVAIGPREIPVTMSRSCKDFRTYKNTLSRLRNAGFFEDEEAFHVEREANRKATIAADRDRAAKKMLPAGPPARAPQSPPAPPVPAARPNLAAVSPPAPPHIPVNGNPVGHSLRGGGVAEQMALVMEMIQQVITEGALTPERASGLMAMMAEAVSSGDMYQTTELITPDLAMDFLTRPMPRLDDGTELIQRARSDKHIDWLAGIIERDEWMLTPQGIILAAGGGMFDGQHRCYAIIKANKPVWMKVTHNCPPKVFLALDQGRKRTFSDTLKTTGHTDTNNLGSALKLLYAVREFEKSPTGPAMLPKNWSRLRPSDHQLIALKDQVGESTFKSHVSAGTEIAKAVGGIPASAIVFRLTAIETWPAGIDALNEFCAMLRDGAGPEWGPGHPAYHVREWLIRQSRSRESWKRELQLSALRKGWAHAAHGETMGGVSVSADLPIPPAYNPNDSKTFPRRKKPRVKVA